MVPLYSIMQVSLAISSEVNKPFPAPGKVDSFTNNFLSGTVIISDAVIC